MGSKLCKDRKYLSIDEECTICLSNNKNLIKLECSHVFHHKCINEWIKINPTCPICRRKVSKINLINLGLRETSTQQELNRFILIVCSCFYFR